VNEQSRAALERAKARLDGLDLYPEPVRIDGLRVHVLPWLFRLPLLNRLDAFTLARTIVFRRPPGGPPGARASETLVTHELVHIWQGQNRRVPLMLSYLRHGYRDNPYEQQARTVAAATRDQPA
jgi:hypothetical protein